MMRFGDTNFDIGGDGRPFGDPMASIHTKGKVHAPISGGVVPNFAILLNGQPVLLNGQFITLTPGG